MYSIKEYQFSLSPNKTEFEMIFTTTLSFFSNNGDFLFQKEQIKILHSLMPSTMATSAAASNGWQSLLYKLGQFMQM